MSNERWEESSRTDVVTDVDVDVTTNVLRMVRVVVEEQTSDVWVDVMYGTFMAVG